MKRGGWMRIYGMQSGRAGKVEVILEARGGNQYLLEVPLKQVTWLGLCMPADTLQALKTALNAEQHQQNACNLYSHSCTS